MLTYSNDDLYNRYVKEQASEAFLHENISEEAYKKALASHPSRLYTPNYFIRIALGVLTLVAIIFSGLLLALMFSAASRAGITGLLFFSGIICYVVLELLIKEKRYYNAGVDNLLMLFTAVCIVIAFAVNTNLEENIILSGVAMLICLLLAARFADAFMSSLSYLALFIFVFLLYAKMGSFAKATAPFLMMIVSAAVFVILQRLLKLERLLFYHNCFRCVVLLTLLTLYASANYFVIKELSNEMFGLNLRLHDAIPLGWLFWLFTFVIPVVYVVYGILKKEPLFIRTGLVLVAATVFTFRYYYSLIAAETAMMTGGALLIVISYVLIKYLTTVKHGFSFNKNKTGKERIDLKALIIAQVAGKKTSTESGTEFGGGSFGSGGADGTY